MCSIVSLSKQKTDTEEPTVRNNNTSHKISKKQKNRSLTSVGEHTSELQQNKEAKFNSQAAPADMWERKKSQYTLKMHSNSTKSGILAVFLYNMPNRLYLKYT